MTPETITSIAGVVIAVTGLVGIIYKMWHDHTSLAIKVTDAFERNAVVMTKLEGAVQANTKTTDEFSRLLIKMSKKK